MHFRKFTVLTLLALLLVSIVPITAQDDATVTITDDLERAIEIPTNPQRVVFASAEHASMVTSLGYVPYAMGFTGNAQIEALASLGSNMDDLSDIINVGNANEPNLETILEIEPDLILWWDNSEIIEQLQQIAPTLGFNPRTDAFAGEYGAVPGPDVERYAKQRLFASIVGLEAELDEQIAEYEALLDDVLERHGDALADLEWSFLDTGDNFQPHMYSIERFPTFAYNAVMLDLGITPSENMVNALAEGFGYDENFGYAQVSLEVVGDYTADLLFVGRYDNAPLNEQLMTLLNATPTGQAEQIYRVDSNLWTYHLVFAEIEVLRQIDEILSNGVENVGDFGSMAMADEDMEASATSFPLTIEHEVGTTVLETVPERIVVLEYSYADHLGTLGVVPVGFAVDAPPEYIYAYTSDLGAVEVGTRAEPNLEAILELSPDLIIADLRRHEEIYDDLSLIAPTVIFNSLRGSYDDQLEQFSIIAEILDKSEEGAEILANYQENFDTTLALTNADADEFVIGVLWSGGFTAHSDESFMGSFLEDLGRVNALEPLEGETQYLLDMEGFASVNPSTIVILCNPADTEFLDNLIDGDLWQAFDAVVNNRVYAFDRNLWSKGRGITAFELILADAVESGLLSDAESQGVQCGGMTTEG
ncbi:MAG: ABC transporter substrate-binding protein [Chloroflexota bacterium]